jgi:hypothetical protein
VWVARRLAELDIKERHIAGLAEHLMSELGRHSIRVVVHYVEGDVGIDAFQGAGPDQYPGIAGVRALLGSTSRPGFKGVARNSRRAGGERPLGPRSRRWEIKAGIVLR